MPNQWEDEDDDFEEEETTDMGDEPPMQKPTPGPITLPSSYKSVTSEGRNHQRQTGKGKRVVRVRPMPVSMSQKWPDVVSCLLTLGSGKQVMFVKGG